MMEVEERSSSSDFGNLLRRHRLTAGLSQEALAERARVSVDGISALERGRRRTPQRETLALLAGALGLDDEQRKELEAAAWRVHVPRRDASVTAGSRSSARTPDLPTAMTTFVGRDAELAEILQLVGEHRFVTITGAGGVGKTQAALQIGRRVAHEGEMVCFVDLAPIGDGSLAPAAVAAAIGVQEVADRSLTETLISYLRGKKLLIIVDNCEHVISEAAKLANALLTGCEHVKILATSREPLRVAGEYVFRLPSLNTPVAEKTRLTASEAISYEAIALFVDRACAADHSFALTDDNARDVAEVCRHLDGIPLAIELAATRIGSLPAKALNKELSERFRLLSGGERTAPARQQTMRCAIDWSYDLLSSREQRLFERLSVFAGGCALADVLAVCCDESVPEDEILSLLSSLVDKSLLQANLEGPEPRYRLLESFRAYGQEKLVQRGEVQNIAYRHASAFLELVERANLARASGSAQLSIERVTEEGDNFRAALQWSLTNRGDVSLGQRLTGELWGLYFIQIVRGFSLSEGRSWVAAALCLADEQTPKNVVARLHLSNVQIAISASNYAQVFASAERAASEYKALNDSSGIVNAQNFMSHALINLGKRTEAAALLRKNLLLARKLSDSRTSELAWTLRLLASTEGDLAIARNYIGEALEIYAAIGLKHASAYALQNLAECEFRAGDAESALSHASDALERLIDLGSSAVLAKVFALNEISLFLTSLARYDEARSYAIEALHDAWERDMVAHFLWSLENIAGILVLAATNEPGAGADCSRAARVLGFAGARRAALGGLRNDFAQPHFDRIVGLLRDELGGEAAARLMADGATITEDEAIELAMSS